LYFPQYGVLVSSSKDLPRADLKMSRDCNQTHNYNHAKKAL
jgi:hypothetical protein